MQILNLTFALWASLSVVNAWSIDNGAFPVDSIKPLKIKMAGENTKAITNATKQEAKEEQKKEKEKPAGQKKQPLKMKDAAKQALAIEQSETPITVNQRTNGKFEISNTDDQPTYPGGEKALRDFIRENKSYPQECKAQRLTGKVTVSITIAPDGVPVNMEITSSSGNEHMDAEAMRVAELMPAWTPAKDIDNGKERIYNMTITFRPGR
jgi:TonB family protein